MSAGSDKDNTSNAADGVDRGCSAETKAVDHTTARVPGARRPDFLVEIARQRLGRDETWKICGWERLGSMTEYEACIVSGGVPRILTRGKRKGRESWSHIKRGHFEKVKITAADEARAAQDYEAATGNCGKCGGGGQEWTGWSAKLGTRYKVCTGCHGTGAAIALTQPPAKAGEAKQ